MKVVVAVGGFDDLRSRHVRFLERASELGDVHVLLWSDQLIRRLRGKAPKFPQEERLYVLQAIRYVKQVTLATGQSTLDVMLQVDELVPDAWAVDEACDSPQRRAYCEARGIAYHVVREEELRGFPEVPCARCAERSSRKKVVVTGCYDWLHSGHIRFFEETSALGDLYVVVGHDQNVRLLKGEGHPMFPQDERRYMVQSIRHVRQALVSTGHGWMDAEPEIARIKPDIYAVNEDGDKPEKRAFCQEHGLEYVVLRRTPKAGLPKRSSTRLRGL
jgi:cytidyltransferase-like protein